MMSEYETVRARAEQEALDCGGMTESGIRDARRVGAVLTREAGLTPERV